MSLCDLASQVTELYPDYEVPKLPEDTQLGLVRVEAVPKKLMALGLHFTPLEKIIKDAVESLRRRGCIA
ncbi:unnamed protein product [Triticum turgidum subsp. durum]|uniref:Uncharacterized protein n=1 Tax=Triticum turgidum subsp. durum TaxID=4567 RepID=A0A9R0QDA3_TRITD|nr:unnamed protein product [Triticum turgidum subsp. durum]